MAGEWVLWYDVRCSASNRALELLCERGIEPKVRRFLVEPPTPSELATLVSKLGLPARAVARKSEDEYHALRLSDRTPDSELFRALALYPRMLERPILEGPNAAIVARPPERVIELLSETRHD